MGCPQEALGGIPPPPTGIALLLWDGVRPASGRNPPSNPEKRTVVLSAGVHASQAAKPPLQQLLWRRGGVHFYALFGRDTSPDPNGTVPAALVVCGLSQKQLEISLQTL